MTVYKKGMQITCPHCNEDSVVKLKAEMDGWTKVGESLVCALCDAKLETPEEPASTEHEKDSGGADALKDFLGVSAAETEELLKDDGDRRFCRDCKHLLEHPFKVYCLLHKKDVNPMDDCEKFERKKA